MIVKYQILMTVPLHLVGICKTKMTVKKKYLNTHRCESVNMTVKSQIFGFHL